MGVATNTLISSFGQVTMSGPPACGLNLRLTIPRHKIAVWSGIDKRIVLKLILRK
jgi:hypothetical protein